jgi:phosphatidylethanolamine-binding protein (PEBP) family uncharacterized protein
MEVFYNGKLLKDNKFLRVYETQSEPHITLNVDPNKLYTLVLYDPDAVSGTYIHWIKANITNNDMRTGNIIIPYKGPAPPPKTGKHHYIFNLYEQNGENKTGMLEEKVFELNKLENKLGVKELVYKIQFISENESGGNERGSNENGLKRTRRNKRQRRKTRKNKKTKRTY